jgi:hypothetical protein
MEMHPFSQSRNSRMTGGQDSFKDNLVLILSPLPLISLRDYLSTDGSLVSLKPLRD